MTKIDPIEVRRVVKEILSEPARQPLSTPMVARIVEAKMQRTGMYDRTYQALMYLESINKVERLNKGRGRTGVMWCKKI